MNDEICSIIDKFGESVGIAIDWSNENIIPYIQDIMWRYQSMSIIKNIIVLIIFTAIMIASIIIGIKIIKNIKEDKKMAIPSIWLDSDFPNTLSTLACVCLFFTSAFFISSIIINAIVIDNLINWIFVPEVQLLNEITSLLK